MGRRIRGTIQGVLTTSARLLRLLTLLQSRREWSGPDLADRLGVTARTLRRDIARLRDLDYPVHAAPGTAGGYRLGPGATLPPLLLDDDEAVAVAVGLRTAAAGTVAGLAEASVGALAKLEQFLPARLRARVATLGGATVALPGARPAVDPDALTAIAAACRGAERLRFGYRDRQDNPSERIVEPHRLVYTGTRWYLVARDVDRDDWRTFRLDRIDSVRATGSRFTPRDPPDAAAFVAGALSVRPYRHHARIRMMVPAGVLASRVPPTVGMIEEIDPGSCILATGSDSLDAIALHLALLGFDFEVLEPDELRDRVGMLGRRLVGAGAKRR